MSGFSARLPDMPARRVDVSMAVVGLVVALALLPLGFVTTEILVTGVPLALGIGCTLYLMAVRTADPTIGLPAFAFTGRRAFFRLVAVGTAGMVSIAAVTGGRPLSFLLLAGAVGSLLLAHVAFTETAKLDQRSVLVAIVVYAAVIRFAGLLTTPGVIGIDTWTHVTSYAAAIQNGGSLAAISGIKYSTTPFYHLIAVAGSEILGVSLRNAVYLTIGVVMPLSVLAVYAAATYVTDVRWALFAALLFAVSEYVIEWGLIVATTSLGLVFFLVVFLFLTRALYGNPGRIDYLVLVAFAMAVTLTHQMSSFVTLTVLGIATIVTFVVGRFGRGSPRIGDLSPRAKWSLTGAFATYSLFTLSIWAVTPWRDNSFLGRAMDLVVTWITTRVGFLNIVEETGRGVSEAPPSGLAAQLEPIVGNLGLLLFLLVAVVGVLVLLQRDQSAGALMLIGTMAVMAVVSLGLPLFGFEFLLPKRWFPFMFAPMAIVGAVGVGYLSRRTTSRAVLTGILVFLVLFPGSMLVAEKATVDQPTFDQQWPQYAYEESELAAAETVQATMPGDGPVYTDHPYHQVITRHGEDPAIRRDPDALDRAYMLPVNGTGDLIDRYDPVVYRSYQSDGRPAFDAPGEGAVSKHVTREEVCGPTRNHVYATEDVLMCTNAGA